MFVGVTIVCVLLGVVVRHVEQQKRTIAALQVDDGVTVHYDFEERPSHNHSDWQLGKDWPELPGPARLRDLIGIDYFAGVGGVDFYDSYHVRDDDLRHLRHFKNLKWLYLWDRHNITNASWKHITVLTSLTYLEINTDNLTSLPPQIGNLTSLTDLKLYKIQLKALPPQIGNLTQLENLNLRT